MAAQYKASPLSRNAIRGMTDYIRRITGTTQTAYFPILTFPEIFLPQIIADFCYEIVPVSEMPDKYGETFPMQNLIKIREDIYYNAVAGDGFARFTICHECGHLLLIDQNTISLCRNLNSERPKPYGDPIFTIKRIIQVYVFISLTENLTEKTVCFLLSVMMTRCG